MFGKLMLPKVIAAAIMLAACGGAAAPTPTPTTATPAARSTETVAAQAKASPVVSPSPTAASTAAPAPTAQAAIATARPAVTFKGIEQGLTADGFPYLGSADAPITLTDYSDFL